MADEIKTRMEFDVLLKQCIVNKATDIHLNVETHTVEYKRFKQCVETVSHFDIGSFVKILKSLAGLSMKKCDTSTGVFTYRILEVDYRFRVSLIQNFSFLSCVVRCLNIENDLKGDDFHLSVRNLSKIKKILQHKSGLILFSGPTGSGKSTSMFYHLSINQTRSVFTIENPIERYNKLWRQVETTNIAETLNQLLRHDPDILMIGEVRTSSELCELIRASLSGHLVCSTIHAGSLEQTLLRLTDLGTSRYELQEMLVGVIYQEMEWKKDQSTIQYKIWNQKEIRAFFDGAKDTGQSV